MLDEVIDVEGGVAAHVCVVYSILDCMMDFIHSYASFHSVGYGGY